jgi:hypothetical protein
MRPKDIVTWSVAVLLVLFFLGVNIYMLWSVNVDDERQWTRAIYLYSGVEAIAFAAAGFLFGREIHRQRADTAEERAEKAEQRADKANYEAVKNKEASDKGKVLAKAVNVKNALQANKAATYGGLGPAEVSKITQADFHELATLANELFPE